MKYTLHNENGDYMYYSTKLEHEAIYECNKVTYKCAVYKEYIAPSPWNNNKNTKHGKLVYKNF